MVVSVPVPSTMADAILGAEPPCGTGLAPATTPTNAVRSKKDLMAETWK